MTAIYIRNPFGIDLEPPVMLTARRRRLSTLVRRYAQPLGHPFVVSVCQPHEDVRLGAEVWAPAEWKTTAVGRHETVLITVLPRGGGGGTSGVKIAATVASLVLIVAAPWLAAAGGGALASALGTSVATAEKIISGGILVGVAAANAALSRALTPNNRPLYSVSGGGNMPRPDDRRPVAYGECWVQPPLTQPDYFTYAGEDMTLSKRVHVTDGDCDIAEVRAGSTTLWRCPQSAGAGRSQMSDGTWALATNTGVRSDVTASFPGARLEFINGQASTLVPQSVSTSPDVSGQQLPFQGDPDPWLGPFRVSAPGTKVNRLQVDFQFPSGYRKNDGKQIPIGLDYEYARCNEAGEPIEAYQSLQNWHGMVNTSRSLRYSWFKDVPLDEYVVRARNNVIDYPEKQQAKIQWDALRGHVPDVAVRADRTEIALVVTSGQKLLQTSFSNITVRLRRKGYVWNGTEWEIAPIRKCVDCYIDALRDPNYGRAKANGEMPLAKAKSYREAYSEFDTFDGVITGPVEIMEAAQTLLFPFRAEPIRMGLGYDFVRDEPLAGNIRRAAFSRREIVQGSTKKSWDLDAEGEPAHFIVRYDLDGDFRRKRSAGKAYGPVTRTPKRLDVPGVSRPDHATHIATWLAAGLHFRSVGAAFDTELAGRAVMRGDPIAADIWFQKGLKVRSVLAVSGTTLLLDAPVTLAENEVVLLRDRLGRDWGPCAVSAGPAPDQLVLDAGDVAVEEAATGITLAAVVTDPGEHRKWTSLRLGVPASLGTNWLVQRAVPRTRLKSSIDVVLDHPQVWAELALPIDPESPLAWDRVVSSAPDVTGLQAYAAQHTSSLELEWSVATEPGAVRIKVDISYDGGATFEVVSDGAPVSGAWPLREQTEGTVLVRAVAFGEGGAPGAGLQKEISTPRPVVYAEVGWQVLESRFRDAQARLDSRIRDLDARLDQIGGAVTSIESVTTGQDQMLVERARRISASLGGAKASITQTEIVIATLINAFAALGIDVTAALGTGSAAGFLRIIAEVTEDDELAALLLGASTTRNGVSAEAAIRMIVALGQSIIQLKAGQTQILDDNDDPFAIFDGSDATLYIDRIRRFTASQFQQLSNLSTTVHSITAGMAWTDIWSTSFDLEQAGDTLFLYSYVLTPVTGPGYVAHIRLLVDGTPYEERRLANFAQGFWFALPLTAGTHTFKAQIGNNTSGGSGTASFHPQILLLPNSTK
jgi:hypothetical protein